MVRIADGAGSKQAEAAGPRSTTDELYQLLRERILNCELPAGSVISQVQLAEELDVNRAPLREALRMLQSDRLIQGEYNRRVRIASLSSEELEQLYAMRIVQESMAIRVSVPRFAASELERLDWLVQQMQANSAPEQFGRRETYHREFHALLISHAGELIGSTADDLADYCERYRRALLQQRPVATFSLAAEEHQEIIGACHERDAVTAAHLLARHLARAAINLTSVSDPSHDPVAVREALRTVIGTEG